MTYGDSVANEHDDIWTQQVQERNAASALHGLKHIQKEEQTHPSEHNGAAMQSHGERMGTLSLMGRMLALALAGGGIAAGVDKFADDRQAAREGQWMADQFEGNDIRGDILAGQRSYQRRVAQAFADQQMRTALGTRKWQVARGAGPMGRRDGVQMRDAL